MHKDDLIQHLHVIYRNDPYVQNLFYAVGKSLDKLDSDIEDLKNQYWFDTMTWAIPILEKKLAFKINSSDLIESKRNQLEARWKMDGKSDTILLKSMIDKWQGTKSDIYFKDGVIDIEILKESNSAINMATINNLIKDSIPCHLPYTATLGYLSFIIIKLLCDKWFSDALPKCGTFTTYEDGAKESIVVTKGWSFKEFLNSSKRGYLSDKFMRASTSTFVSGEGHSILKAISKTFNRYFSDNLMKASENTFAEGNGYSINKKIYSKIGRFFSEPFLVASENTFIYEKGVSYKGIIVENYNSYFSEKFKTCSENLYSEGGELIYDS